MKTPTLATSLERPRSGPASPSRALRRATSPPLTLLLTVLAVAACADASVDPTGIDEVTPTATADLGPTLAPPGPPQCQDGVVAPTGALVRACIPSSGWNGDLVVWAHGYVSPYEPLALPDDAVGGQTIEAIVASLGYGYATSSYRDNGLVADDAVEDLDDAVDFFKGIYGAPGHSFLVGGSEGGLAAALSLERPAPGFDAGMILCAPVGSFRTQVAYFGDFRVLLDAYFPGLVDDGNPSTAWQPWGAGGQVLIPPGVIANWPAIAGAVAAAAAAQPARVAELLRVAGVSVDPGDPSTVVESALAVLWYNVFATNDLVTKLGGLPYGNRLTWYRGSSNDWLLNRRVQRINANSSALAQLAAFETDGSLSVPGVGMHTSMDPVIPLPQGLLYRLETLLAGVGFGYNFFPVSSYGHCAFEAPQVLAGFALMVLKGTGWQLSASSAAFGDLGEETLFLSTARELGASPTIVRERRRE